MPEFKTPPATIARGFTILEMIVVMLITSMIATLAFQSISLISKLQDTLSRQLDTGKQFAVQTQLYRQVIHAIQPDRQEGQNLFSGQPQRISGLTSMPIASSPLGLASFSIAIKKIENNRTQALYQENDKTLTLLEWEGKQGRFLFLDNEGKLHENWPASNLSPQQQRQIPSAILLQLQRNHAPWLLVAACNGPLNPLPKEAALPK